MTGKQLRNSILQWAIQGKLVPQDPNDEPASVLLERIRAEKVRLVKEKKIKRDKNESIIYRGEDNSYYEKMADGTIRCIDSDIPFEIPQGWEWCRLRNVCTVFGRIGFRGYTKNDIVDKGKGAITISPSNMMENGEMNFNCVSFISWFKYDESPEIQIAEKDILVVKTGSSYGKTCVVRGLPEKATINPQIAVLKFNFINPEILCYILNSPLCKEQFEKYVIGTSIPTFSQEKLSSTLIPLPPLNEQNRLVNIIGDLFGKTDVYCSLKERFDILEDRLQPSLKKSILQEAIQGRLVPQIASEGTAEELLAEIRAEKMRLIKEGKLKASALKQESRIFRGDDNKYRQKIDGAEAIIDDRLPFEIPDTWRWVTLGELILDSTGLSYKKEALADKTEPMVRVLRGGNIEEGQMLFKADDIRISSKYVPDGLYLRKRLFISPAVSSLEKIGKTALVDQDYTDVVVGGFVLMLSPLYSDDNLGKYLYYFFQTGYYHNYCRTITKKSGQAFYNLSRPKLKECYVPIPPKDELPRIISRIEKALASIMSR